jgi:hypothetical protein
MSYTIEDCEAIHETEKALLVESENFDTEDNQIWIPQSQIHSDSEVYKEGTNGLLVVTTWFAEQKGWL